MRLSDKKKYPDKKNELFNLAGNEPERRVTMSNTIVLSESRTETNPNLRGAISDDQRVER